MSKVLDAALNPGATAKSAWYSLRYTHKLLTLPIESVWESKIKRAKDSIFDIQGKLSLGTFVTQLGEIGQRSIDRTVVQLGERSRLSIRGVVDIGPGVRMIIGSDANVLIENGSFISANSQLLCKKEISIGKQCAISWGVLIMDTDFHSVIVRGNPSKKTKPVHIGNHVWIGANVTILKGVHIGDEAVIGAGSVVRHDVPAKSLVIGNPAEVVKSGICWTL